ncbi:hypothetical protein GCK72_016495 [Caenorhabditis remanei]|uniref:Uncharacterized protein n=1 Tax=Caenorhabditis remanei TaxID=31234 RepID=A0A6A5G4S7_CAERE|nr:hypothetical protein GCK72_016495 [Caenorhabditis remanei]KAF1749950.1 hypothetical protein GCK72_016495 [Caenorhabditis remanei]
MSRFAGKVAIITGSSNGIGRAAAVLFAREGAKVTITGRNTERLEETRQQILAAGVPEGNVNSIVADVTTDAGQDQILKSTLEKFGKLDILVNNAGAAIPDSQGKTGISQGLDTYDATLNLNMRSVIALTKKAVPHLTETKGEIVNISSIASGLRATPEFSYYSIAKAALDQYTRNTAIALIEHGIRVNSISPGLVATGFGSAMGMPEQVADKFYSVMATKKECVPAGVMGQPNDIAEAIAFLADRKASSYIIGHQLVVDGGSSLIMGLHCQDFAALLK